MAVSPAPDIARVLHVLVNQRFQTPAQPSQSFLNTGPFIPVPKQLFNRFRNSISNAMVEIAIFDSFFHLISLHINWVTLTFHKPPKLLGYFNELREVAPSSLDNQRKIAHVCHHRLGCRRRFGDRRLYGEGRKIRPTLAVSRIGDYRRRGRQSAYRGQPGNRPNSISMSLQGVDARFEI